MLVLSPLSIPERFTVTFSLQCKKAMATVRVKTNGPPTSGTFHASPEEGVEFDTIFLLAAKLWVDEDLPLAYTFTFGENRQVIKSLGPSSYVESSLPVGIQTDNFKQLCQVSIYDTLGAVVEDFTDVVVQRLVLPASELNDKLSGAFDSAMESTDPNVLVSFLSVASAMMNFVDCNSAPDCTILNREACKGTSSTCGPCLPDYLGESGDSNSQCE
jgi:hypothetical protein